MTELIKSTKLYYLSTQSSSGTILNNDPNYKSKMQYYIPPLDFKEDSIEYVIFSVPNAVIPCSMFNVDYSNNQLDIFISGSVSSFIFESGNYNSNTFMNKFLSILGTNWRISFDNTTNLFSISHISLAFTIKSTSTIDYIMGFNTDLSSSPSSLGNTVIMSRTCNFLQIPRINIKCKELANSHHVGISTNYNDILVSIPNDAPINGKIIYRNISGIQIPIENIDILTGFQVCFCDEDNNLINFNGLSCYFTFQFDIYRKRNLFSKTTFKQLMDELNHQLK